MTEEGRAMRDFMIVEETQKQDNRPYKPDNLSSYLTRHAGSGNFSNPPPEIPAVRATRGHPDGSLLRSFCYVYGRRKEECYASILTVCLRYAGTPDSILTLSGKRRQSQVAISYSSTLLVFEEKFTPILNNLRGSVAKGAA